jgi:sugar/nucleoside kinase (ribokinase family)
MFEITGAGSVVVDDLIVLPEIPGPNTKIEIIQRRKQIGGSVPLALKTLAKFGAITSIIGKTGDDEDSAIIKKQLIESGIDVTNLILAKGYKSSYAQVWIDIKKGTRSIAVDAGNVPPLKERNIDIDLLPESKLLHVDGKEHDFIPKIIDAYRKKGAKISLDTGRYRVRTLELIPKSDIIICPLSFALEWIGRHNFLELITKAGIRHPNKLIIITDGRMGSVCAYQGNIYRQKAFKIDCVDSTGVGGVHAGALLYGILKKWKVETVLEFAAAVAALKCKKLGNNELPSLNDVKAFLS